MLKMVEHKNCNVLDSADAGSKRGISASSYSVRRSARLTPTPHPTFPQHNIPTLP